MKRLLMVLLLLATMTISWAQPGQSDRRGPGERPPSPEKLQQLLNLTDVQMAEVETLYEETRTALLDLRDDVFESDEARREEARKILEAQRVQLETILNEEQLDQLEEFRKSQFRHHPPEGKTDFFNSNDERKAAIEAYRSENIEPVMRQQRAKLEAVISDEDKATIEALRANRPVPGSRETGERPTEAQREVMKANRETIKSLLETYKDDIQSLMEEIEPQSEQWEIDIKAIFEEFSPESVSGEKPEQEGARHRGGKKLKAKHIKAAHFLLMDPAELITSQEMLPQQKTIAAESFPNPAVNQTKISYDLPVGGTIRIELLDKSGNVERVLYNGLQDAGHQELEVDLTHFTTGVYYYRIMDEQGNQFTQKLVITKG